MDRDAFHASIFLDHRIVRAGAEEVRVPAADLPQPRSLPQLGWILHMAHGGSTLLARALDALGDNLVLREPFALRQLALEAADTRLPALLGLFAQREPGAGLTIVKANVPVNTLLPRLVTGDSVGPAVLLWSALEDYLPAILRSEGHRGWVRTITTELADHLPDLGAATDAVRAAALWLMQARRFLGTLDNAPAARTLESGRFLAEPGAALAAVAPMFGIAASPDRIAALVAGPLFATYSKNPAHAFDNRSRIVREEAVRAGMRDELEAARRWVDRTGSDAEDLAARLRARAA